MNPFYRLAPFIQEYIWRHHWDELRDVQVKAIDAILDSPDHVLIAAGTASGKTEAAFFPMLSMLAEKPTESFGILYVGPLKALINDQFERIAELLDEADFPIYAWHGDRPQSEKQRAKRQPKGVLQITPEALEGLLMNHSGDAKQMFSALQFIVIDELHAFMGTDRGLQLQCQLVRMDRLLGRSIRRVGLSATIHDYASAQAWLCAGTNRECALVESHEGGRRLDLAMRHFTLDGRDTEAADQTQQVLYDYLYQQSQGRKCLIFTNSRIETEEIVAALRERAERMGEPDVFHAHHGSVSASLREEAESALRESDKPAVAVATRTLELGIDLGGLDRVIQLGSPSTCSSFVQRLGRTGRRGMTAVMRFVTKSALRGRMDFEDIPWELIQNIAIIQLYIEERWVESFVNKPLPFSVLFHQILSALMQAELTPRELARRVYTLPAFSLIPQEDYMALIRHLLETDIIEKTESGTLIPGLLGEKLAGNYRFLSVFADHSGYRVVFRQRDIGEIDSLPEPDEIIALAGRRWRVTEIDADRRVIYVVPSKGKTKNSWSGGGMGIDDRIAMRMRQVLAEDTQYAYLYPDARDSLAEARERATRCDLDKPYSVIGDKQLLIHPWLGSRKMDTLFFLLDNVFGETLEIQSTQKIACGMGIVVTTELSTDAFWDKLMKRIIGISSEEIVSIAPPTPMDRYDAQVPEALLRKAYVYNGLDVDGLRRAMEEAQREY